MHDLVVDRAGLPPLTKSQNAHLPDAGKPRASESLLEELATAKLDIVGWNPDDANAVAAVGPHRYPERATT
jgi:hypothetical protein